MAIVLVVEMCLTVKKCLWLAQLIFIVIIESGSISLLTRAICRTWSCSLIVTVKTTLEKNPHTPSCVKFSCDVSPKLVSKQENRERFYDQLRFLNCSVRTNRLHGSRNLFYAKFPLSLGLLQTLRLTNCGTFL